MSEEEGHVTIETWDVICCALIGSECGTSVVSNIKPKELPHQLRTWEQLQSTWSTVGSHRGSGCSLSMNMHLVSGLVCWPHCTWTQTPGLHPVCEVHELDCRQSRYRIWTWNFVVCSIFFLVPTYLETAVIRVVYLGYMFGGADISEKISM